MLVCCLITLSVQTKLTTNLCNTKQNKTGSLGTKVAPINRIHLTHIWRIWWKGGDSAATYSFYTCLGICKSKLVNLISFSIWLHIPSLGLWLFLLREHDSALFCSYQQNRAHVVGAGGGDSSAATAQLTQLSAEENLGRSGRCFSSGASHLFVPLSDTLIWTLLKLWLDRFISW